MSIDIAVEFAAHTGWNLAPELKPNWIIIRIPKVTDRVYTYSELGFSGDKYYWFLSDGRIIFTNNVVHCEHVDKVPENLPVGIDITKNMVKYMKEHPQSKRHPIEKYIFKTK